MTVKEQASCFRLSMVSQMERLRELVNLVAGRSKLLAGSLYQRRKRCGKRGCRCNRGQLHREIALTVYQHGSSRYESLADLDMEEIKELVERWKQFRMARKEMIGIFREILSAVDGLGKLRQTEIREIRQRRVHWR